MTKKGVVQLNKYFEITCRIHWPGALLMLGLNVSNSMSKQIVSSASLYAAKYVRNFELEFFPVMPPQQPHRAPRARATRPLNTAGRSSLPVSAPHQAARGSRED